MATRTERSSTGGYVEVTFHGATMGSVMLWTQSRES